MGGNNKHKLKDIPSYVAEKIKKDASISQQWEFLESYLGKFVDEFVLTEFDIEKKWEEENERRRKEREAEQMGGSEESTPENSETLFIPGMKIYTK